MKTAIKWAVALIAIALFIYFFAPELANKNFDDREQVKVKSTTDNPSTFTPRPLPKYDTNVPAADKL